MSLDDRRRHRPAEIANPRQNPKKGLLLVLAQCKERRIARALLHISRRRPQTLTSLLVKSTKNFCLQDIALQSYILRSMNQRRLCHIQTLTNLGFLHMNNFCPLSMLAPSSPAYPPSPVYSPSSPGYGSAPSSPVFELERFVAPTSAEIDGHAHCQKCSRLLTELMLHLREKTGEMRR
jgi:hypothetical protein